MATTAMQRVRLPRVGGRLSRYILRRLALAALTLFLVTIVVFSITNVLPGNPALVRLGGLASPEAVRAEEKRMGLDRPLPERYWDFVSGAVVADFGRSFKTERPVASDLGDRLPATLELALLATFLSLLVGVPLGFLAAARRDSAIDHAARTLATVAAAMPIFWLGLVLVFVFAYQLGWAPGTVGRFPLDHEAPPLVTGFFTIDTLLAGDIGGFFTALHYLALPVLTLAIIELAPILKMARSSMVETLDTDYVRTSRALGFSPRQIFFGDAVRNALIPVLTLLGIVLGYLVAGSVIVETLFSWPGIGRYAYGALTANDFNAIQGFILLVAAIYVLLNLAIDLLYAVIDPRIRLG
jgi:ABC-type dipeptide/oligopeptide/nickel transport system permease component